MQVQLAECDKCLKISKYIQDVQEKNFIFSQFAATPPCPHRCTRPSKLLMQCECTVTFFVQPIAAECWRGRAGKLSRILEKKQYLMSTLYIFIHEKK